MGGSANPVKLLASKPIEKSGVDLFKADAVVAAGRGFAEEADLDLARALAEKLGGGLACSRPLTEGVNWLPTELYVGVSGLMLSPKVYVGRRHLGQMQHMVGCNRAGSMFAINKDKNAPVFKQCDYGLVGDVKDVLPALTAALYAGRGVLPGSREPGEAGKAVIPSAAGGVGAASPPLLDETFASSSVALNTSRPPRALGMTASAVRTRAPRHY